MSKKCLQKAHFYTRETHSPPLKHCNLISACVCGLDFENTYFFLTIYNLFVSLSGLINSLLRSYNNQGKLRFKGRPSVDLHLHPAEDSWFSLVCVVNDSCTWHQPKKSNSAQMITRNKERGIMGKAAGIFGKPNPKFRVTRKTCHLGPWQ